MSLILIFFIQFISIASANEPLNVAVSYFANNSNDETLNNLEKGIAEMLITDLSISQDIRLVERERLNDVLKEIDLQKNPYFDSASASQLGKGLGAGIIVTGSFLVMDDTMRIDARLIDVDSSEVLLAVESNGTKGEFFNVQAQLAKKILSGIGSELTILDQKKIGTNGTKDFGAFTAYSTGLSALDQGNTEDATIAFKKAGTLDPDFTLANDRLKQIERKARNLIDASIEFQQNFDAHIEGLLQRAQQNDAAACGELQQTLVTQANTIQQATMENYLQQASQLRGSFSRSSKKGPSQRTLEQMAYTLYSISVQFMDFPRSSLAEECTVLEAYLLFQNMNNLELFGLTAIVPFEEEVSLEPTQVTEIMNYSLRSPDNSVLIESSQFPSLYLYLGEYLIDTHPNSLYVTELDSTGTPILANRMLQITNYIETSEKMSTMSRKERQNFQYIKAMKSWLTNGGDGVIAPRLPLRIIPFTLGSGLQTYIVEGGYRVPDPRFSSKTYQVSWEQDWVWEIIEDMEFSIDQGETWEKWASTSSVDKTFIDCSICGQENGVCSKSVGCESEMLKNQDIYDACLESVNNGTHKFLKEWVNDKEMYEVHESLAREDCESILDNAYDECVNQNSKELNFGIISDESNIEYITRIRDNQQFIRTQGANTLREVIERSLPTEVPEYPPEEFIKDLRSTCESSTIQFNQSDLEKFYSFNYIAPLNASVCHKANSPLCTLCSSLQTFDDCNNGKFSKKEEANYCRGFDFKWYDIEKVHAFKNDNMSHSSQLEFYYSLGGDTFFVREAKKCTYIDHGTTFIPIETPLWGGKWYSSLTLDLPSVVEKLQPEDLSDVRGSVLFKVTFIDKDTVEFNLPIISDKQLSE